MWLTVACPLDNRSEVGQQRMMQGDDDIMLPGGIEVRREVAQVPYRAALEAQTTRNAAIAAGEARELIWLLEHPPVYTAGTSAVADDVLDPRFDVVSAGRGGRHTYHGPGQRVGYVLLDLRTRARDVRGFVHALEGWVIDTLGDFGVEAWRSEAGVGIWTRDIDGTEAKIGAIGVRIRRWVTMHGFAVNLSPDLSHFTGIVPCGIATRGVTSLARLGKSVSAAQWDRALLARAGEFLAHLDQPCPPPVTPQDLPAEEA
jgi:lipoyl(octanoyl) transferase